jgi:hypothetical protein
MINEYEKSSIFISINEILMYFIIKLKTKTNQFFQEIEKENQESLITKLFDYYFILFKYYFEKNNDIGLSNNLIFSVKKIFNQNDDLLNNYLISLFKKIFNFIHNFKLIPKNDQKSYDENNNIIKIEGNLNFLKKKIMKLKNYMKD